MHERLRCVGPETERVSGPNPYSNFGKRPTFEVRNFAYTRSGKQGQAIQIE